MVTTTSLVPDLNVAMRSLENSVFEEDRALVDLALKAIVDVVCKIKPLIHYIGIRTPAGHILPLTKMDGSSTVTLNEDGKFGYFSNDKFTEEGSAWKEVSFQSLLDDLTKAFQDAEAKREAHLKAVETRRKMLEEISKIASGSVSTQ